MAGRKRISRRDSLKGIATTGSLLGGAALGASTAAAGDDDEDGLNGKKADKLVDLDALCVKKHEEKAAFRIANKSHKKLRFKAKVSETGKKEYVKVDAKSKEYFTVHTDAHKRATVGLYHDGEKVASASSRRQQYCGRKANPHKIDLEAICYEDGENEKKTKWTYPEGKFRIDNHNDQKVKVSWDSGGVKEGQLAIPANSSKDFWVSLGPEKAEEVRLYYRGKKIDVEEANTDTTCKKKYCKKKGKKNHCKKKDDDDNDA